MKKLTVSTNHKYDILIEKGLLNNCGTLIKNVTTATKVAIISDSNVYKIYGDKVNESLKNSGFKTSSFVFPAGEESKVLSTMENIYNFLSESYITRKDIIVALGGGVVGDIAGFAAATHLRGIPFVQIPTSLLAHVDSSVGGKTGIDTKHGKNLVGAFWQPSLVIIDPLTLNTLPEKYINDGMAEIIKYGCISSKALFNKLKNNNGLNIIEEIIYDCVQIKSQIVSEDERETGKRILLNFGHTLGHSLEKIYNFKKLSHGEAVAIGMLIITKATEEKGLTAKGTTEKILSLCKKYNLPTEDKASFKEIANGAKTDKKTSSNNINLVLLKEIGTSFVKNIPIDELESFITSV